MLKIKNQTNEGNNMRNKIYSERRRKLHTLINHVLKNTFISKFMQRNETYNQLEIDPLTGIYNQFAINHYLKELHPQSETSYGIILLSVNNFNDIKTQYNTKIANKALITIANELSQNIRETDLVGRYSESEFIIILSNVTQTQAESVTTRLTSLINKKVKINKDSVQLNVSCGVSTSNVDCLSNMVLQQADEALYTAKQNFYTSTGVLS